MTNMEQKILECWKPTPHVADSPFIAAYVNNKKLIKRVLGYFRGKLRADERRSCGMVGCYKALGSYDLYQGATFQTWLAYQVRYECLNWLREKRKGSMNREKQHPEMTFEEAAFSKVHVSGISYNTPFELIDMKLDLPAKDFDLISTRYLHNNSVDEISKQNGMDKRKIYKKIERIKKVYSAS